MIYDHSPKANNFPESSLLVYIQPFSKRIKLQTQQIMKSNFHLISEDYYFQPEKF